MAGAHTKAILNLLTKPKFAQFLLNTEANMRAQISPLTAEIKELNNNLQSWRKML